MGSKLHEAGTFSKMLIFHEPYTPTYRVKRAQTIAMASRHYEESQMNVPINEEAADTDKPISLESFKKLSNSVPAVRAEDVVLVEESQ